MSNTGTGNQVPYSDLLQVLLTLKQNTMRSTNVAEVCQVISEDTCKIISSGEVVNYICLSNLIVQKNDIILIVFTDTDFRNNLKRIQANRELIFEKQEVLHTRNCGIAIGLIYQGGN